MGQVKLGRTMSTSHPLGLLGDMAVIQESVQEMKSKDSKEWAHRHCVTEHVCFTDEFREKLRRYL